MAWKQPALSRRPELFMNDRSETVGMAVRLCANNLDYSCAIRSVSASSARRIPGSDME